MRNWPKIERIVSNYNHHLNHEIPADIEYLNQNETDKTNAAHIEDFSAKNFYVADSEQQYNNAGIIFCPHDP